MDALVPRIDPPACSNRSWASRCPGNPSRPMRHLRSPTPSSMGRTSMQTAELLPRIPSPGPTLLQPRSSAVSRNHNRMDELLRREPSGFWAALPGSLRRGLERHAISEALTPQALHADWGAIRDRAEVLAAVVALRPGGLTPVDCCTNADCCTKWRVHACRNPSPLPGEPGSILLLPGLLVGVADGVASPWMQWVPIAGFRSLERTTNWSHP